MPAYGQIHDIFVHNEIHLHVTAQQAEENKSTSDGLLYSSERAVKTRADRYRQKRSAGEMLHGWVLTSVSPGHLFRFVPQEMPGCPCGMDTVHPIESPTPGHPQPTLYSSLNSLLIPSLDQHCSSGSSNLSRTRRSGSGRASLGSLRLVVLDSGPDGVFGQHRAMELDRGQTKRR